MILLLQGQVGLWFFIVSLCSFDSSVCVLEQFLSLLVSLRLYSQEREVANYCDPNYTNVRILTMKEEKREVLDSFIIYPLINVTC